MITVKEVDDCLQEHLFSELIEEINLTDACGRILAEDIVADRDFPPFDRVTMDGIAINLDAWKQAVRDYPIESIAAAGQALCSLKQAEACIEVMTGAMLPKGTDLVIPYEWLKIEKGTATILDTRPLKKGMHIHAQGKDDLEGALLIKKNRKITAAEIAILATVGKHQVKVKKMPKIAILATGDELVPVHQRPLAHQIRSSNVHMLTAALQEMNLPCQSFHLQDHQKDMEQEIAQILDDFDILMISGGVSKGKFDFVPAVLKKNGVTKLFHRVKQKPGKPFWWGKRDQTFVFAFPGNPVSAFLCFHRYFKFWYSHSRGFCPTNYYAKLSADVNFSKPLTYFLQVAVTVDENGQLIAEPHQGNGSGDLTSLITANGFLALPAAQHEFKKGTSFPFYPFKEIRF